MKPLPKYVAIKDKCAIFYLGNAYEYVVQLMCVMPYIRAALHGLEVDVFCKDEASSVTGAKPLSAFEQDKYGYVKELGYNLDSNCVEKLLIECRIPYGAVSVPEVDGNTLCAICPDALLPNKPLNQVQIKKAQETAQNLGYTLTENATNAGWVIGPENFPLILAASKGIKTSLIPTGFCNKFYKTLFPRGEILNY